MSNKSASYGIRQSGAVYDVKLPSGRTIALRAPEILERGKVTPGGGPGKTALYRRLKNGERRLAVLLMPCDPYAQRLSEIENPSTVAQHIRNEFWSRGYQMKDICKMLRMSVHTARGHFAPRVRRPLPAHVLRRACDVLGVPQERRWALMCMGAREHGWDV